ncbi:hypothetical protein TNCV_5024511 [Trichonephila clavipes]|nr:hypothetical protein TNCV_5024511 [Trichonephila clavipes]
MKDEFLYNPLDHASNCFVSRYGMTREAMLDLILSGFAKPTLYVYTDHAKVGRMKWYGETATSRLSPIWFAIKANANVAASKRTMFMLDVSWKWTKSPGGTRYNILFTTRWAGMPSWLFVSKIKKTIFQDGVLGLSEVMGQCPMDKSNEEKPMDKLDEDKPLEQWEELMDKIQGRKNLMSL